MKKSDFYFDLPERLIAQHPLEQRDASRMMVLDRRDGSVTHRHFHDMLEYVKPGDCVVFNNSRVIPARLMGHAVGHVTPIEVLLLTDKGDGLWECLTRPGRKTRAGVELTFGDGLLTATVEAVQPDGNRLIRFHYEGIFLEILDRVKEDEITDHVMHSEFYVMDEETAKIINDTRDAGGDIWAVGTTATRTLETIANETGHVRAQSGWTAIFIYPGYRFKAVDHLITNFHLPESTLMMLISAFASREMVMNAYQEAIREEYRFFSFGDSMMLY